MSRVGMVKCCGCGKMRPAKNMFRVGESQSLACRTCANGAEAPSHYKSASGGAVSGMEMRATKIEIPRGEHIGRRQALELMTNGCCGD